MPAALFQTVFNSAQIWTARTMLMENVVGGSNACFLANARNQTLCNMPFFANDHQQFPAATDTRVLIPNPPSEPQSRAALARQKCKQFRALFGNVKLTARFRIKASKTLFEFKRLGAYFTSKQVILV